MKANEIEDGKVLMIGDLVVGCIETDIVGEATYKILCKVTDINHYGDVRCEALKPFPDELDWQDGDDLSWIEPIPLTPEILEKNGFEVTRDMSSSRNKDVWSLHVSKYKIFHIIEHHNKKMFPYFWIEIGSNSDIKYVHQLQHALRLCGIEKEIIL